MTGAKPIAARFARKVGLALSILVGTLYISMIEIGKLFGAKGAAAAIILSLAFSFFLETMRKRFVKNPAMSDFLLMMNWYGYMINAAFKFAMMFAELNVQYFRSYLHRLRGKKS